EQDQDKGTGKGSVLPFDLDPRADEADRESEASRDRENIDDRETDFADRRDRQNDSADRVEKEGSFIEQAAGAIGERVRDEVSKIVDGVIHGEDKPQASDDAEPVPPKRGTHKPRRPATTARDDAQVERLTEEILDAFSAQSGVRDRLQVEIGDMLDGVPATIARQALADWRADLYGTTPDPDSATDAETSLRQRIVRQLDKARVSMGDLPTAVRDRLKRQR
ncbi:MAG: hypothetical protein NT069_05180, partial [Planctomycetota bacterium]|nr:hypothetical protein [Planctomycetota bacterium]